ncbi:phage protein NinX family protein [Pantoea stewartii]|uniref:phage protein NinX family protein n=1 Tax=Pantoea stewartii TaxID=66269 RepID=UPI00197D1C09|nr:phage protein NinX family protein [Pantoea stewartii]
MNYSEMSDFEINSRVARAMKFEGMMFFDVDESICNGPVWNVASGLTDEGIRISRGNAFHPCSSWADAGPIIQQNLIDLEALYDFTDESEEEIEPTGLWAARAVVNGFIHPRVEDKNPRRAAMIAFLMAKEKSCE